MTEYTLRIGNYNVRGLMAKDKLVHDLMDNQKVDILACQETLLNPSSRLSTHHNYKAFTRSINEGVQSVLGSAMLIRKKWDYKPILKEISRGMS